MVVIFERYEAKRLQYAVIRLLHRAQDFGHTVHGAGLRLEGNFHKIALAERLGQAQQASRYRDGLEFSFGAAAVFKPDCSENGIS